MQGMSVVPSKLWIRSLQRRVSGSLRLLDSNNWLALVVLYIYGCRLNASSALRKVVEAVHSREFVPVTMSLFRLIMLRRIL